MLRESACESLKRVEGQVSKLQGQGPTRADWVAIAVSLHVSPRLCRPESSPLNLSLLTWGAVPPTPLCAA